MKTYLTVYVGSALLTVVVTPIVIRLARRLNIVDAPDIRKVHSRDVPRIGGVAIFVSTLGLIVPVLLLPNVIGDSFRSAQSKVIALLCAATFMFLTGLIDDVKGLPARVKLLAQSVAAVIVCSAGIRINSVTITDSLVVDFGVFSWPITILWIVGITNAVNIIDGLDGLAAGIGAAACGVIAVLSLHFGPPVMTVMMLCLLGSLTGFLFFNFNPAKIFMGDSGSLFLGFTIASSSVLCAAKTQTMVALALPVLVLGLPIFDTLVSMLRRFLRRRSVFSADCSHFHHRLLALGLRHRHAVIAAYGITLLAAGLGMFMLYTRGAQTIVIFVSILVLLVLALRAVGSLRLREIIAALKQRHTIDCQTRREIDNFEKVELHFHQARTFEQWWRSVCFAADRMGFVRGLLPLTNRDGSERMLSWEASERDLEAGDIVRTTLPIRDRRAGSSLNLEVQVPANGSLESAGRRITLFGRLLEDYSVATLPN